MENQIKNSYRILNIEKENVNKELLRKCYFKEALKYHPDKNDLPDAKDRFHKISESYEILMKYHGYMDDDNYVFGYNEEKTEEDIPNYTNVIYSFLQPILNTVISRWVKLNDDNDKEKRISNTTTNDNDNNNEDKTNKDEEEEE